MSQPAFAALAPLPFELVYSDGVPLDSEWHGLQQSFLRTLIRQLMAEQGRTDFFAGKNMFVYYSVEQAREVWRRRRRNGRARPSADRTSSGSGASKTTSARPGSRGRRADGC